MDWQGLLTPSLTAAIGAILAGIMTWFVQSRIEALRRETERLRDERKNIYMEILEPMIKALQRVNDPDDPESAMDSMWSFGYRKAIFELNFIGSDRVVEALNDLMQGIYSGSQSPTTFRDTLNKTGQSRVVFTGAVLLKYFSPLGVPR